MTLRRTTLILCALLLLVPLQVEAAPQIANAAARGSLPSDRLHFGLANSPGTNLDWMVNSGVPWRYRYQYLSGGINTGGGSTDPNCGANVGWQTWNTPAGQFATYYISDSTAHSYIPVFTYYEIVQSNPSPGNESALLTKISATCTMQAYWADFTVLMQKVGASGALAVVHVEPDFWGFMEQQNADPTTIPASVASSGNADLAGLPNTVQGMGWAFLKLRDKYAPNALLAVHASTWASSVDISTDQRTTVDPAAEADKVIAFINKVGLVGNPTGVTPWDVIFNDVADHDAAWYGAVSNNHWWDKNNVGFPNFSRWLAFSSRMHTVTGLPLVVWQVPVGNQYYQTMNNTDGHYQDNRAEYFLAHPRELAAAGLVAVLFGKANAGQTNYTDEKGDGVTNPGPVSSWQCNQCNTHVSTVADDDGGFLRMAVGAYYRAYPGTTCTLFPFDSVFNADISALPINTQSSAWMGNMSQNANLHPDLGTIAQQYGMPINVAPPPAAGLAPTFSFDSESDHPTEGYPIDQSTLIEGGAGAPSTSDRHALVINKSSCKLYELYNLQSFTNGQVPAAGSGAVWDMTSNAMRPAGWTSADAAGLPITPLLLRPDEIQAGTVAHAIRLTAHCTSTYIWPASHQAGSCSSGFPPMGARFRLKSSFNISTFSPSTQVVLRAFQHYGLVLADNGADWYFGGTTDDWWGSTAGGQVVSELKTIPAAQFDAVDESGLQAAAGSYQVGSGPALCATPTISAAPTSQQAAGGTVVLTASTSGCINPQYRFWTRPASGGWTMAQDYSASNTFNWTSNATAGAYFIGVHVRAGGSTAAYDNFASIPYTLTGTACSTVTETASPASPQASGTQVTLTATAGGCPNARYEFWARWQGSSTWQLLQGYSTSNTYRWNSTGAAAGTEYFGVWVKDASSGGMLDANSSIPYSVTTAACTSVAATAAPASIGRGTGAHVTITGAAAGCAGPTYEFWMRPASSSTWQLVQGWSTKATYDWNSTGAAAGTIYFGVWAKDPGSSSSYDATALTTVTVT